MITRRTLILATALIADNPGRAVAGTWDTSSFANDGALDWVAEFTNKPSAALVRRTLDQATRGSFIDSTDGQGAIAAAEVVAHALGRTGGDFPNEIRHAADRIKPDLVPLAPLAARAVEQVVGPSSELRDMWAEQADSMKRWRSNIQDLLSRLKPKAAMADEPSLTPASPTPPSPPATPAADPARRR